MRPKIKIPDQFLPKEGDLKQRDASKFWSISSAYNKRIKSKITIGGALKELNKLACSTSQVVRVRAIFLSETIVDQGVKPESGTIEKGSKIYML